MANTWNDLWAKAGSLARTAAAATRHAADSARLSINIAAEEEKLKNAYAALGRIYFQALESGTDPQGEEYDRQLAVIRETLRKIEQFRQQKTPSAGGENTATAEAGTEESAEMSTVSGTEESTATAEDFDDLVNPRL